jgi:MFS transporter, ACS family, hexuronate transporter
MSHRVEIVKPPVRDDMPLVSSSHALASAIPWKSWWILSLLFVSGFLNYFDRQTLSILKTTLKSALQLDDVWYSHLVTAFMVPYIIMYIVGGRLVDRWGHRFALTVFLCVWSLACVVCGIAQTVAVLLVGRVLLGLAEPGAFPAMQAAIITWFPKERRAFAMSLNAPSTTVGAILAPPLVALVTLGYDWHGAFLLPGLTGLLLALMWWVSAKHPPSFLSTAEVAAAPTRYRVLLRDRRLWGLIGARALSDPVWYFHLFWLPGFFQERLGLTLAQLGWVGWIPSAVGSVALIVAGSYTDRQVARGQNPVTVRFNLFLAGAAFAALGAFTTFAPNIVVAIILVSLVTIGCQLWFFGSGILLADLYPRNSMASAFGLVGAFGASAALLMNVLAGPIVQHFGYRGVFIGIAFLHPMAALVLGRALRSQQPAASAS